MPDPTPADVIAAARERFPKATMIHVDCTSHVAWYGGCDLYEAATWHVRVGNKRDSLMFSAAPKLAELLAKVKG